MTYPHHSRKYTINENFFSDWSPKMAYVLGLWYADGYMRISKSYRIVFTSNDLKHLMLVNKVFAANAPIEKFNNYYVLTLRSKKLFINLSLLGGNQAKSRTLTFPKIPKHFLNDFVCGYFDGDGSVHKIKYKASKNNKKYTEIQSNFTSGSKSFLISLRTCLCVQLNLSKRVIGQHGPHQFKLDYGQTDTGKLLKWMYYKGHKISLKRKADYLKYFK